MKMLRNLFWLLLLVAVIFGGRWAWFYRGSYRPPAIPTIDPAAIALPDVAYAPVDDEPRAVPSGTRVVLDFSHANNLAVNDLAPLRARLAARGVDVILYDGNNDSLKSHLHAASALLILAPTTGYAPAERDLIQAFVADGGRLLLAADPTRPVSSQTDEDTFDLISALFPKSAIPAINSIAQPFDVIYFDDYLYNLADNAGNYRNIRLTAFDPEHALTRDLETLVFFAAHSLRSDGRALVVGDADTRSSVRTGETGLAVVTLSAGGNVLALGDVTFLTAPYHTQGDNDRFLGHIADWLAVDNRQRDDFADFPYMFTQPVDLTLLGAAPLDPRVILHFGDLQTIFAQAGLTLTLRAAADPAHDALLLGVFSALTVTHPLLSEAGITVTLPTPSVEMPQVILGDAKPAGSAEPLTATPVITEGTIEIETMGTLALRGTSLLVMDRQEGRRILLVLAEDSDGVAAALVRLARQDFTGCVETTAAARRILVCSNGQIPPVEPLPIEKPIVVDVEDAQGALLIISADTGDGARTGAAELEKILSANYTVKLWSVKADGLPTPSDLADYDAYIFAFGDYVTTSENAAIFGVVLNIDRGGIMLIGEQPLPRSSEEIEFAPLQDLQVWDAQHALMEGFAEDEILSLSALENDIPAMVIPDDDDADVLLVRGPESAQSGSPALIAGEDSDDSANRYIIASFAFYRLPEEAQRTLALNIAAWLLKR